MAEFHIIETGYFLADGGAMFGPIPKKYWSKRYPCDDNNMCKMAMRCLFIETDDRKILIDCGSSDKQLDKLKYYQPHDFSHFVISRKALEPASSFITHFDDITFAHF